MSQTITIDPVSRIEGHAKITIELDEQKQVRDAHFHITQFRGFEKFCEGRPFTEMPSLMARICGICPVSHLVASAKACDAIMAVRIPETAAKLRRIMNLAQHIQSHALSFFHLSSPDLLLGMDSDPATRNIFGVMQAHPHLALDGIKLRKFGQQIIEWLGGKRIHPAWIVPGGVNEPLTEERRDQILAEIPGAMQIILRTLEWFKEASVKYTDEIRHFANFNTMFFGLVDEGGGLEMYDGVIRIVDAQGNVVADRLDPANYQDFIGEAVEPYSYLKSPYYKNVGYPEGIYRVGPLARLNIASHIGTPLAHKEWEEFRGPNKRVILSSFHYHLARLIEILYGIEMIEKLLNEPDILSDRVRAVAGPNSLEGIGVSEAPRGTLMHHYRIDKHGLITWANLIIATGHNNLAMNKGVLQVAKAYLKGTQPTEGMLNRVEAVIRCYDPCLSCSTHAVGHMPLVLQVRSHDGEILGETARK
ncbi:MAG: Ni/Fe hydrogenase subunit alpha [Candidatus Sumerlaeaceae bacterium]|nr:Ni/Fe hydrogenase subunit alpha [Candidatus Sumerlaeaceae bacterium]